MAAIELKSLSKEFSVASGTEVAVDDVSLEIDGGEFFTLVGPSGCGKTTTLRCIAGLETPTSGEIRIDGEEVTETPPHKRNIAMMFQNIALYPHMLIKDNISYPLKVKGVGLEERYERAREAAEVMQISDLLEKHPGELSGGQRQRAALARTIVQDPVAFLMDEPLSDLDAKLKIDVREEIQRVHKNLGKPTVYVTHDQEEAMTMSDRVAVMNDGHLEQVGAPTDLYHHPSNRFVGEFLGKPSMNLVDVTIESLGPEKAVVELDGTELSLPVDYVEGDTATGSAVLGFRPEAVTIDEGGPATIPGRVTLVEPVGARTLLSIETDSGVYRAVAPGNSTLEEDQSVSFSLASDGTYLFDSSGALLAKGAARNDASSQTQRSEA